MRALLQSRVALAIGIAVTLALPVLTLPRLPEVTWWPALLGLAVWMIGKYVLCPLRWRALSAQRLTRWWHARVYAESELFGLATPGHVGGDLWRLRRLSTATDSRLDAVTSVGLDRVVSAIAVAAFVVFAGAELPWRSLLAVLTVTLVALGTAYVVHLRRPDLLPKPTLPRARPLIYGLLLSLAYELSIAVFVIGTVAATGHDLPLLALLAAFGASQLAGAVPGPHGASPRDAALVVGLVAVGMPWMAATAAVALKSILVWAPALVLGGASLLAHRRTCRKAGPPSWRPSLPLVLSPARPTG
ncbi:MAG TPA: lysylphosphatidylglycerol synthase domain-containing protein [Nocardioidaceae bacterium]|nr:lysylphosphatidylglycerol synthase domain-containing protein [Nocardioidaceae bacterium]